MAIKLGRVYTSGTRRLKIDISCREVGTRPTASYGATYRIWFRLPVPK